ncbi:MAG: hypothetical protein WBW14_16085 [Candidatus Acidiferrum sp.]
MLEKSKLKKNAIAASLQGEIAREIEELFGSQALEEIDFEALETAMRRRALQLAARFSSSDSTVTIAITKAARCPVPVAAGRVMSNDDGKVFIAWSEN